MGNEEVDLVTVTKPTEKKSLLRRYDIPVEHLSYEYISECTNSRELERIVLILRSGEEGVYPDLTKHAEKRLTVVKPDSKVLRVAEPVLTRSMLEPEERKEIDNDIDNWMHEMQNREKDLNEGKALQDTAFLPQPEIRRGKEAAIKKPIQSVQRRSKSKRLTSCDYTGWDKYDADTELDRIDLRDEQQQVEAKRIQRKHREEEETARKLSKEAIIDKLSLTGTELSIMAEREKEKGNEAFKANDYEEALQLYNSSIAMDGTINVYNNRAITYIKLQRYDDAVNDCNQVLSMEYTNVKALLRRGLALEHLEKKSQALADYEAILMLEPTNKLAISAVNRLRKPCASKKVRMKIEEEYNEEEKLTVNKEDKLKSQRISDINDDITLCLNKSEQNKICSRDKTQESFKDSKSTSYVKSYSTIAKRSLQNVNITSSDSKLYLDNKKCSEICFCDRAPGSSQNLRPLPHFKSSYCSTSFPNLPVKKSNTAINVTQLRSNFTNIKINKPSGVTIEELSNETHKPALGKDTKVIKDIDKNDKSSKNSWKVEGDTKKMEENKKIESATEKESSVNDKKDTNKVTERHKQGLKVSNVKGDVAESKKIVVASKYEKSASNVDREITADFNSVESPYEFTRVWQSLKNDSDLSLHARLLRSLAPEDFNIGNKLDGTMFSIILRCLEQHFCTPQDTELVNRFLTSFSQLSRFSIVNMLMDTNDKKVLQKIFAFLKDQKSSRLPELRQAYSA